MGLLKRCNCFLTALETCERNFFMIIDVIKSIILGVVEGITEWLPISSTGHLILAEEFFGLKNISPEFTEMLKNYVD